MNLCVFASDVLCRPQAMKPSFPLLPRDHLTLHFLPRLRSKTAAVVCICAVNPCLLYLLWSRLCLQQPGVLIASIHYSALLRLYHTPKQHRNKTRLRIGMKCVSADQVVGRWAGGSQDWEVWAFICAPSFINCPGA